MIHCYNPVHFEKWRWDTPDTRGIGGSETAATELCRRLAARGYSVNCYVPLPDEDRAGAKHLGVQYLDLTDADFTADGVWVIFRDAACVDSIPAGRRIWLVCQDESPLNINPERAAKCEKVIAFCEWHKRHLEKNWPEVQGKVVVSSNGLKMDLLRETLQAPSVRNPKKLIFASSPDRGLIQLCKIFTRAREFVPDLELHCFYGVDNIEKLIEFRPQFKHYKSFVANLKQVVNQPGIHWRGRISQRELYREWLSAGIWCYPTHFNETSCITSMEAQALGAIPVFNPIAALRENVTSGVPIEGDAASDALIRARYVAEIVQLALYPQIQDQMRPAMMAAARNRFNWERITDQWQAMLEEWPAENIYVCQFAFQRQHAMGRVLNVGCADDPAGLGQLPGAVNLDAAGQIPWTGKATKADILADARQPLPVDGTFDTVVIGDMLEHLTDSDVLSVLRNTIAVLSPTGRIVITCPEDYRPRSAQHARQDLNYLAGESAYHDRPITHSLLTEWLSAAGLREVSYQSIDYGLFVGHGIIATRNS